MDQQPADILKLQEKTSPEVATARQLAGIWVAVHTTAPSRGRRHSGVRAMANVFAGDLEAPGTRFVKQWCHRCHLLDGEASGTDTMPAPARLARGREVSAGALRAWLPTACPRMPNSKLADPELYHRDPDAFQRWSDELEAARGELDRAETRWLELEERRERLAAAGPRR